MERREARQRFAKFCSFADLVERALGDAPPRTEGLQARSVLPDLTAGNKREALGPPIAGDSVVHVHAATVAWVAEQIEQLGESAGDEDAAVLVLAEFIGLLA